MERSSSSLILRRKKSVTDITCLPAPSMQRRNSLPSLQMPPKANRALQILEELSPLVGAASRSIFKKVKKMTGRRSSCPDLATESLPTQFLSNQAKYVAARQQPLCMDIESSVADAGFVRLVYKKARLLRAERNEQEGAVSSSYNNLREVVRDIMHSVRVCLHVRRFIALAKAGSDGKAITDEASLSTDFVVEPIHRLGECETPVEVNNTWDDLMADLSPMTPQVKRLREAPARLTKPKSIFELPQVVEEPSEKAMKSRCKQGEKALRSNMQSFVTSQPTVL